MTSDGEKLETIRIVDDPERLQAVLAKAGEAPEVVLEATYGWYWRPTFSTELGAHPHLARPLGVLRPISRTLTFASRHQHPNVRQPGSVGQSRVDVNWSLMMLAVTLR